MSDSQVTVDTSSPKIPFLGVLTLNRTDLLMRLIESIDHPVSHMAILFQNVHEKENFGRQELLREFAQKVREKTRFVEKLTLIQCNMNIGVSRGWNYFLRNYLNGVSPAGYCLISGDDNYFAPGALATIAAALTPDMIANNVFIGFRMKNNIMDKIVPSGFSTFVATPRLIEKVGFFDENIYPAYYEDSDLWRRISLSGEATCDICEVMIVAGDDKTTGSCTLNSLSSEQRKKASECFARNRTYFHEKWGPDKDFLAPFDRADIYTIRDVPPHRNYFENQKIIMGHENSPEFEIFRSET